MFVDFSFERERLEPVAFVGDNGCRAAIFKEGAEPFTIIGLVRQQFLRGRQLLDEQFGNNTVVNMASRQ